MSPSFQEFFLPSWPGATAALRDKHCQTCNNSYIILEEKSNIEIIKKPLGKEVALPFRGNVCGVIRYIQLI